MNVRTKFEVPVPEITRGIQKIWAVPGYAHAPFSPKFYWAFVRLDLVKVLAYLKSVASPVPQIIASFGWELRTPQS